MNFLKLANYRKIYFPLTTMAFGGFLIFSALSSQAQIVTYSFTGATGDEVTLASDAQPTNGTATVMSRGSGITAYPYAENINAYNWGAASSIDLNDYYEFTVYPNTGQEMTFTSLTLDETYLDPIVADAYYWTVRSSLDGFSSDITTPFSVAAVQSASRSTRTGNTITLTGGTFDNLTEPVTFRIYAYDVTNPGNLEWSIDNVVLNGSISASSKTSIGVIDFESANYTLTNTFTANTETDYWGVYTAASENTSHNLFGTLSGVVQGASYLAGRDIDAGTNPNRVENTTGFDVSAYDNLDVVIALATTGTAYDAGADDVTIEYDYDNNNNWQVIGQFSGDGSRLSLDADFNGTGEGGALTSIYNIFNDHSFTIPKEGSFLKIRVTGFTTGGDEDVLIDNIRVRGLTDSSNPTATVTTSTNPVTLGALTQTVTVTYSESMDTGTSPAITFGTSTNFTSNSDGAWSTTSVSNDTWTESFTHNGTSEEIASETVSIASSSGATDIAGNTDIGDTSPSFVVDTQKPTATVTVDSDPIHPGDLIQIVTVSYDEDMDAGSTPAITFGTSSNFTSAGNGTWASSTTWTETFNHNGTSEQIAAETANVATTSGATDVAGNTDTGDASPTFVVDTQAPTATVTISNDPIGGVTLSQAVTVSYNESMNAATSPTITFNGSSNFTSAGDGAWSTVTFTNDTWSETFNHSGASEYVGSALAGVASSSGAQDLVGNDDIGDDSPSFIIDTQQPTATVTISTNPINIGNPTQTVTVTYSESMDTGTSPAISFGTSTNFTSNGDGAWSTNGATNNTWTETFTHNGTSEVITSETATVATTSGATDLAGNTDIGDTSPNFAVDTHRPTATVTIDSDPITPADLTQIVTVTYTESMDTGTSPVIAFGTSTNFTGGAGGWSTTTFANDTWTQTFTHNGGAEFVAAEIATVANASGATNLAGNPELGDNSPSFIIDTQGPTATVTVDSNPIHPGDLIQVVTVTYNEAMDAGTSPTITFGTSTNFVSNGDGAWSTTSFTNDTWTETFTHNGSVETVTNEIASVSSSSGATDLNGIADIGDDSPAFVVDTQQPVATVTTSLSTIYTGALTQTVIVTYDESMNTGSSPAISFSGSTNFVSNGDGAWSTDIFTNDTWTETFTHNGTAEEVASVTTSVATTSGATDVAGNSDIGDTSPGFLVDTQRPTISSALLFINAGTVALGGNNHEVIHMEVSEPITLANAAAVTFNNAGGGGFDVDDGNIGATGTIYRNNATYTRIVQLESAANSSGWVLGASASQVSYITGGNIFDAAGNELQGFTGLIVTNGNTTPPVISPDVITLFPNGILADELVFTLDEELDILEGGAVTGFTTSDGLVASGTYTSKGVNNTITLLNGGANWTSSTTVSYSQITGNVINLGGAEMADFTAHPVVYENIPPAITALSISSSNTTSTLAKGGDVITITFTADDGLDLSSLSLTNIQSGGVTVTNAALVNYAATGNTFEYTAQFTIDAADTDGAITFTLNYSDVAGNAGTAVTEADITDASSVTVDNTLPSISSILADDANPNNTTSVNYTVTFSEPVSNVDINDFSITKGIQIVGGTVSNVTPLSASQYTVTISGFDLNDNYTSGGLRLDFVSNGTVTDNAGTSTSGNYNSATIYTIIHPEPAEDVPTFTFISSNNSSITLSWTESAANQLPNSYLLLAKKSTDNFTTVVDGTFISNGVQGVEGDIAANLARGTSGYTFTGLASGTDYDFIIYPYTNTGTNVDFKTTSPATVSGSTTTASVSTIAAGPGAEPATISSLVNSSGAASVNFDFTITDDGATPAADDAPMTISDIIITKGGNNQIGDWTTAIAGAELSDGGNTMAGTINATNITFSGILSGDELLGEIDDNESKTYTLTIWLNTSLPDGADKNQFDFAILSSDVSYNNPAGSSTLAATQSVVSGAATNTIAVVATELNWTTQPAATIGVMANFATAPVVTAQDVNGNRDEDFVSIVTLASNNDGIAMNNSPAGSNFLAGILTFSTSFSYAGPGDGTLAIEAGGLATPASGSVAVSYSDNTLVTTGPNAEPATLSALFTQINNASEQVFDINIQDDASGLIVNDIVPTSFNQITFRAANSGDTNELTSNWSDIIANALIFDGSNLHTVFASSNPILGNPPSGGTVGSDFITFSSLNIGVGGIGYIADGTTKNIRLYLELKPTITNGMNNLVDGRHFHFSVDGNDLSTEAESSKMNTTEPAITSGTGNIEIVVEVTQLTFEPTSSPSQQPGANASYGSVLPIQPIATARDINNNLDRDYIGPITVTNAGTLATTNNTVTFNNGAIELDPNFIYNPGGNNGANGTLTFTDNVTPALTATTSSITVNYSGVSDIVRNASFNSNSGNGYDSDIPYEDFQGASITDNTTSVVMEGFTLRDGGGTSDDDGSSTTLTSLTLEIANWENLRRIELFDAAGTTALSSTDVNEQNVTASTIQFTGLSLVAPDDGTIDFTIRVSFNANVDDNETISFTVTNTAILATGSQLLNNDGSTSGGVIAESVLAGNENRIEVTAGELSFVNIPGASLNTSLEVEVRAVDVNQNIDLDFVEIITSYSNNSTTPGGPLATINEPTVGDPFVNGVYFFPFDITDPAVSFQFTAAGEGVTITLQTASFTGISNSFDITSSFESYISYVSDGSDIPYISHPPVANLTAANSYKLAEFIIHDGNPALYGNDLDGASTVISNLTITITNSENLDMVGIFDAGGTQYGTDMAAAATITFTSLNFSAPDNGTNNLFIRASFKNDNNVSDNDVINVAITNVEVTGGSQFEDRPGAGGEPDGLGGYKPVRTPLGNNKIEVVATSYIFTQSPAAIEGVNVALTSTPIIEAQDANGIMDIDHNEPVTITSEEADIDDSDASLETLIVNITNGTLNLSTLRYFTTGYGTLSVSGSLTGASSGAVNSTDVVATALSQITQGVEPAGDLPSGGVNKVLLAFRLNARSNTAGEPKFNSLTLHVSNDTTDIFEDFRLYKLITIPPPAKPIAGTDFILVSGAKVNKSLSTAQDVVIDGFSDVLDGGTDGDIYFVVADISTQAYFKTPATNISLGSADVNLSNGSVVGSGFTGNTYTFKDSRPPTFTLTPANGSINVAPDAAELIITFDEPVIALDTAFRIFLFADNSQVFLSNSMVDISTSADSTKFSIAIPTLSDDTKYYVRFPTGSITNSTGFIDRSGNTVQGITTSTDWSFTTADKNPPIFTADPIATNIYNNGFDVEAQIDEVGTLYYMVVANNTATPSALEIFNNTPPNPADLLASGSLNITQGFINHYISISGLSQDTDYDVYIVAEDVVGNQMNDADRFKIDVRTANLSGANAIVFEADATLCIGQFQEVREPIHIIELNNNDFKDTGSTQTLSILLPSGFSFNTDSLPSIEYNASADIAANPVPEFFNSSVLNIQYTMSGESNIDKLSIRKLYVKAASDATFGSIVKSGDASIAGVVFGAQLGTVTAATPTPVNFTTQPPTSLISITDVNFVELIPSVNDGINVFTGTAVSGMRFGVPFAGVGSHTITLTHTDVNGCVSTFDKTIEIVDTKIEGLNSEYCADSEEVTILASPPERPQFTLIDLKIDTTLVTNPGDTTSLRKDGNNWIFDPYTASMNATENVSFDFVGIYESIVNTANKDTIRQRVKVWLPPGVLLKTNNFGAMGDSINYCEDGNNILLEGSPKPFTGTSTGVFNLFKDGAFSTDLALIDKGDGTATLNPQLAADSIGYGALDIRYIYTNDTTSCIVTSDITININPKPKPLFEINASCAGEATQFTDVSEIAIGVVNSWQWNFDDIAENFSSNQNPEHVFANTGSYDVNLIATSDKLCVDNITIPIDVGGIPQADFTFTGVNIANQFSFNSITPKPGTLPGDEVQSLIWSFGDGTNYPSTDNGEYVFHTYSTTLIDTVSLTIQTTLGCTATKKKPIAVLEKVTDISAYNGDFESGNGGWVILPDLNNSWTRSDNNGDINQAGNSMWVTNANDFYLAKERSYIYSPTFDISTLERPMIQFDAYSDLATGDGVVLQYSIDNLNIADPAKTWFTFGGIRSGVDWYEGDNLASKPGEINDIGWADFIGLHQPKHSLADIPDANRNNLNFRFALASVNDPTNKPGFAFDNLFLGNRTRTVLIENFTNTSQATTTKSENTFLKKFISGDNDGVEVVNINYHTDFPGYDPINAINTVDPSARAVFYNISKTPRVMMDGFIYDDALFSTWGDREFNLRSLNLAPFDIQIAISTANQQLEVDAIVTAKNSISNTGNLLVYVAVLEQLITLNELNVTQADILSGEDSLHYALRKLLPHAAGTKIASSTLIPNIPSDPISVSWIPAKLDLDDVAIVVFIQDELTKEVYQAEIVKNIDISDLSTVTSTTPELENEFRIYPNPANKQVTILLKESLDKNARLRIIDGFGKVVFEHQVDNNEPINIDTKEYAAGLYHVQLEDGAKIIRKRLLIMHR